ncbi:B3 domain-containing transcription factor VRN1-like [Olea europaea subsp. europaea]|uniref:B3 domain-containing transcription factor VRN1-like n=1 Tax=Olea europaea subsp. europaea TaxID=158383 RepID=A0A8S0VIV6_OLEEU|nr:B3 domain-containing transcription factor VRN1-like [Olea europaea subsp. europaea]
MLPRSFVNDWRHKLGDTIQVTAYDDIIVTIRSERDDGRIYFADGWEQFFDHHSLQDAHVLAFEYNGNSTFDITIFDHSGLEVTYDSDVPEEYNVSHTNNPAFEITLTPHHNSHRKIDGSLDTTHQEVCEVFISMILYITTGSSPQIYDQTV